jgi:hypothetical protein
VVHSFTRASRSPAPGDPLFAPRVALWRRGLDLSAGMDQAGAHAVRRRNTHAGRTVSSRIGPVTAKLCVLAMG